MSKIETAYLGGGCFWCLEPIFNEIKGVQSVIVGYGGGISDNPSYEQVSSGQTGHAEIAKIDFDPGIINFETLLEIFFSIHDPSTPNRLGNDIGTQYRSIILFTNEIQQNLIKRYIDLLIKQGISPVTEIKPLEKFFPAEDYHQKYFESHQDQPYCEIVISPKIKKFRKRFSELLK